MSQRKTFYLFLPEGSTGKPVRAANGDLHLRRLQRMSYAERCKKTDKNRSINLNEELTSIHREVLRNLESIHGACLRMNRSIQAEGAFGVIKQNRKYRRIARRGHENVRLEVFLVILGYNLYKYCRKQTKLQEAA